MKSVEEKEKEVIALFADCHDKEMLYQKVMDLGRLLKKLPAEHKNELSRVSGCQSTMYLHAFEADGRIFFEAESDALISAGLAALLLIVYGGESPETIIKANPAYLEAIGITKSLTPGRSNGLFSILLKMKQLAIHFLTHRPLA